MVFFIKSEKLYVFLQYEISIKVLIVYNLKNLNVKKLSVLSVKIARIFLTKKTFIFDKNNRLKICIYD